MSNTQNLSQKLREELIEQTNQELAEVTAGFADVHTAEFPMSEFKRVFLPLMLSSDVSVARGAFSNWVRYVTGSPTYTVGLTDVSGKVVAITPAVVSSNSFISTDTGGSLSNIVSKYLMTRETLPLKAERDFTNELIGKTDSNTITEGFSDTTWAEFYRSIGVPSKDIPDHSGSVVDSAIDDDSYLDGL